MKGAYRLTSDLRSQRICDEGWAQRPQRTQDGFRLVMSHPPEVIETEHGCGVRVHVRLFHVDSGDELPIDPDRTFVNPPIIHQGATDPTGALWAILWDQVWLEPAWQ